MTTDILSPEIRIFLLETGDILNSVEGDLIRLEKDTQNAEITARIFRGIHTIKGNCGFLNLSQLEKLCHTGESLLDKFRLKTAQPSSESITALLQLVDAARHISDVIETTGTEPKEDDQAEVSRISGKLTALCHR